MTTKPQRNTSARWSQRNRVYCSFRMYPFMKTKPLDLIAWTFGWLSFIFLHNHVRRSIVHCSFSPSHDLQLLVVRTSFWSFFRFWFGDVLVEFFFVFMCLVYFVILCNRDAVPPVCNCVQLPETDHLHRLDGGCTALAPSQVDGLRYPPLHILLRSV